MTLMTIIFADRRSAKVCLKALPFPFILLPTLLPFNPNRKRVHRLYVAYSKLYKEKKERPQHTIRLKSDIKSVKLQFTKINEMQ